MLCKIKRSDIHILLGVFFVVQKVIGGLPLTETTVGKKRSFKKIFLVIIFTNIIGSVFNHLGHDGNLHKYYLKVPGK